MEQKEFKGLRLVITDLDSNEVVEDSVIDCFIGGISRKDAKDTTTSMSITRCKAVTIMGTVGSARKAAKRTLANLLNDVDVPEKVRRPMLEELLKASDIDIAED